MYMTASGILLQMEIYQPLRSKRSLEDKIIAKWYLHQYTYEILSLTSWNEMHHIY